MTESGSSSLLTRLIGKRDQGDAPQVVDELTELPDRINLVPLTGAAIQRAKAASSRCAVGFVSVHELRDINDTHGPAAGDNLLQAVGARLKTIDLPGTQVVRYQGSEFSVVLEGIPNPSAAEKVCDFLVELMHAPFDTDAGSLSVPCHVGLALSSDAYDNPESLVQDAHEALVRARKQGPNAWHIHDESKRMLHSTRIDEARLLRAIEDDEFLLHYQPIVRLDTQQLIGIEALIRWQMPGATNVGLLYPHDFMPLLERTGLAPRVGNWVLARACEQTARWQQEFSTGRPLFVTINIGAHQLAAQGFAATVRNAIGDASRDSDRPVEPWQVCLDITEDALHYNRNASWSALRELKQLGVKLGLDDFGTGVSSLLYLRQINLDLLRIDRVFVDGLEHNTEDRAIVKHITRLAHDLGLITVAEGVENAEQVEVLQSLGVDLAQGFHFGRPETAEQITERLRPEGEEAPKRWDATEVYDYDESTPE